MTILVEKHYK